MTMPDETEKATPQHESFDLESVYDKKIAPLMTKIIDICREHKLPMFATFLYMNDLEGGDDGLCTTYLLFEERPIPEPMMALQKFAARPSPLRIRTVNKEGVTTHEEVIFP